MTSNTTTPVKWLVILFLLGLAIRIVYVTASPYYLVYDDINYHNMGLQIARGSLTADAYFSSAGFPLLVGVLFTLFGEHFIVVQLVQCVLSSLSAIMMYYIGTTWQSIRVGFIAFVFMLFNPSFIRYSKQFMSETLFIFLLVAIFYLIVVYPRLTWSHTLILGVLCAFTAVTRNIFLFFIPVIILWLMWQHRAYILSIKYFSALVLGLACILIPFFMANNHFMGAPFISSGGAVNLWMGNNPDATGFYDMDLYQEKVGREDVLSHETSVYLRNEVIQFVKTNPWQFLMLFLKKVYLLWKPDTSLIASEAISVKLYGIGKVLFYIGTLLVPGLMGIWLSRKQWRRYSVFYLFILYNTAIVALHVVLYRYRMPTLPCIIFFSAITYAYLWQYVACRWFNASPDATFVQT